MDPRVGSASSVAWLAVLLACISALSSVVADAAATPSSSVKNPSITILIWATPSFQSRYEPFTATVADYAARHGYELLLDGDNYGEVIEPPRTRSWGKVLACLAALEEKEIRTEDSGDPRDFKRDWVVVLDADLMVNNPGVTIEAFLSARADLQSTSLNAHFISDVPEPDAGSNFFIISGFFAFRNTPWSRSFLRRWWAAGEAAHWELDEQHALWHALLEELPFYSGECSRGITPKSEKLFERCVVESAFKFKPEGFPEDHFSNVYGPLEAAAPIAVHISSRYLAWPRLERLWDFPYVVREYPWRAGWPADGESLTLHTHKLGYAGCAACSFGAVAGERQGEAGDWFRLRLGEGGETVSVPAKKDGPATAKVICSYYGAADVTREDGSVDHLTFVGGDEATSAAQEERERDACATFLLEVAKGTAVVGMRPREAPLESDFRTPAGGNNHLLVWMDEGDRSARPGVLELLTELMAGGSGCNDEFLNGVRRDLLDEYCCDGRAARAPLEALRRTADAPQPVGRILYLLELRNEASAAGRDCEANDSGGSCAAAERDFIAVPDTIAYGIPSYTDFLLRFCEETGHVVCGMAEFLPVAAADIHRGLDEALNKRMGKCWNWYFRCEEEEGERGEGGGEGGSE